MGLEQIPSQWPVGGREAQQLTGFKAHSGQLFRTFYLVQILLGSLWRCGERVGLAGPRPIMLEP